MSVSTPAFLFGINVPATEIEIIDDGDKAYVEITNGVQLQTEMPLSPTLFCTKEGDNFAMELTVATENASGKELPFDNLGEAEFRSVYDKNGVLRKVNLTTLFGVQKQTADAKREEGYREEGVSALDVQQRADAISATADGETVDTTVWKTDLGQSESDVATTLGKVERDTMRDLKEPEVDLTLISENGKLYWEVRSFSPRSKPGTTKEEIEERTIPFQEDNTEAITVVVGNRKITVAPARVVKNNEQRTGGTKNRSYLQISIAEIFQDGKIEKAITLPMKVDAEYLEGLSKTDATGEKAQKFRSEIPISVKYPV